MMMDINVLKQHFEVLPKKHKFLVVAVSLLVLVLLLYPGPADSIATHKTADQFDSDGRVSVAIPNSLLEDQEMDSLVITSEDLLTRSAVRAQIDTTQIDTAQIDTAQLATTITPPTNHDAVSDTENIVSGTITLNSDIKPLPNLQNPAELIPGKRYALDIAQDIISTESHILADDEIWQTYQVKRGDNLAKIFSRAGLTAQEVHHVSRAGKSAKRLLKIKPGEELQLLKDSDGSFKELQYSYSPTHALRVFLKKEKYRSEVQEMELYSRLNYASGEINSNFWNAGMQAGLSDNLIMSLATIFGWDIDFALDIRQGDNFNVIFEENYIEGEFVGYGDIVAAEFTNQGEHFAAVRYKDGNYYTPEGRSMRKSFLRAPVNFKYISSSFKPRRFHPVQKRWKAHNGIDYAASTGTPVLAAGDGKVIKAAYNKFNGNYVFIQHGDTYTTKYLHFSKRAVKTGQWVKQGQVIGYVGATGLASGPHLHYEFLVNGKHKNPRTVKLPKAVPIAKKEKADFLAVARDYQEKLANNRRIMLAMN